MAFTSQVAALASPTTVDTFKTALDADLASLETGVGITSAVLALPTNHVPADFYAAFMADIQALAYKGVPLSLVNATGRESWSTFMASLKSDMGLLVNYFSTPTLSINNVSLTEGNTGTKYATFTVSLSHTYYQNVTFDYATVDGTATVANNDYTATSGTGTIPTASTTYTINVPIIGDTTYEGDETFTVNLSNPINATIATGIGTGTIINDDAPTYYSRALFDVADTGVLATGDLETQAAGSVQDGAFYVVDQGSGAVRILGQRLSIAGSGSWGQTGLVSNAANSRTLGLTFLSTARKTMTADDFLLGFRTAHSVNYNYAVNCIELTGTTIRIFSSLARMTIGPATLNTDYEFAVIVGGYKSDGTPYASGTPQSSYSAGASIFVKGGTEYPNWTLLIRTDNGADANLYAGVSDAYNGGATADSVRVTDFNCSNCLLPQFLDTFQATNGTAITSHTPDVGGTATILSGSADIQSNLFDVSNITGTDVCSVVWPMQANGIFEMTVKQATGSDSIIVRSSDVNNAWYVELSPTAISIYDKQAGNSVQRATASHTKAAGDRIVVICDATTITAIVGFTQISYSSTFNQTATLAGIRSDTIGNQIANLACFDRTSAIYDTILGGL